MVDLNSIKAEVLDSQIPVIMREQLDMLLMIDDKEDTAELVVDLLNLFQMESREKFEDLETLCMRGDVQDLRKILHFVAGSAGNLGMSRLALFYRAIENAIEIGELTQIGGAAELIRAEYETAVLAFKVEFDMQ